MLAVLEHVRGSGTYPLPGDTFQVRIGQTLILENRPGAALWLLRELEARGFELAEYPPAGLNLHGEEIRVSFDTPAHVAPDTLRLYAELAYVWACPIGDIEAFTYLVACEGGSCRVIERDAGGQAEIGVDPAFCSSAPGR